MPPRQRQQAAAGSTLKPSLNVPPAHRPNSRLVELLIYNGWPFADHWEYFVANSCASHPDVGTVIQAAGNVRDGFWLEIKRGWDLSVAENRVDTRIGLGWVGEEYFQAEEGDDETGPVCEFERALFKVPAPEKSLRVVGASREGGLADGRARITQRNCQTWVVQAAEQLAKDGILDQVVVDFLRATKQ
ncbi:hypothetical protein MMYC01_205212 [Madurella mycetomatis]|uniref:Uncharacterized protein n=1 Tax=Madurella mycetomatis TaxID=100816 RepID=A0A175W7A5_9PEZI|nr:hypothetical protein MMYC01_205212 [Madurella mycetomatis]